jgi:tetratricopeptide (TPR) repeat protein
MSTMSEQLARTQRWMDLQSRGRDLLFRIMPGQVNEEVIGSLEQLMADSEQLASEAGVDDQLTPRRMVDEFTVDIVARTARAYDTVNQATPARAYYERAKELYERLGKTSDALQMERKLSELRLNFEQDIDGEMKRLRAQLKRAEPESLEAAETLLSLGELAGRAGDDFGALKWLHQAEEIFSRPPYELPDADTTLSALGESLAAIMGGTGNAGSTSIETAMQLRGLHQRLYVSLAASYRRSDPQKSESYDRRVANMDADRTSKGSGAELLEMLKNLSRNA